MRIILFIFIMISPLSAESPFHTEVVITSEFGSLIGKGGLRRPDGHKGTDCHAVNFYPGIFPVMDGKVIEVGIDDIYGKYVIVETVLNGITLFHMYAHGKTILYAASGEITTDTMIMIVGESGYTDGIHLHLSIYEIVDGEKIYYDAEEFF